MTTERNIITGRDYRETNIHDQGLYVEGDYYHNPPSSKELTETGAELEALLNYFQKKQSNIEGRNRVKMATQNHPSLNNAQVIQSAIETNPPLQQRIRAAGEAAYIETVKMLLPPVGIAIEAFKAFKNP